MKNKLWFLKKFKGVLSIIVLICHLWSVLEGEPEARFFINFISRVFSQNFAYYVDRLFVEIGGIAVWYFFIITGIGIRMSLDSRENIAYKRITSRYFKLMIPVLLISFVSFVLMKLQLFACNFSNDTCLSEWTIGKNAFEPNLIEMIRISVFGMWFTNELNCYVTFTWCMFTFLWGAYVCYAIWGISHSWETKHTFIFLLFLSFLLRENNISLCIWGYLIAELYCTTSNYALSKYVAGKICVCVVAIFTVLASILTCNILIRELLVFFSCCIMVFNADKFERILSRKTVTFLGNISYEIYLIQYVVLFTVTSYLYQHLYPYGAMFSEIVSAILTIPIVIICAIFFSCIIKYLGILGTRVESRILKMNK